MKFPPLLRRWLANRRRGSPIRDGTTGLPLQAAALPWRRSASGGVEYLLVTSRNSNRWIVPKGWPLPKKSLPESAEQEAYEEAGVRGRMRDQEIGRFEHLKRDAVLGSTPFTLALYPLEVEHELDDWPEKGQRSRQWFSGDEARAKLQSDAVANLIREFEAGLAAGR